MGALARWLEEDGLATTSISLVREHTERIKPPRALWTSFELGRPFGVPGNAAFQMGVLKAALDLFWRGQPPVLEDYPLDAPAAMAPAAWACPIDIRPPAGDLGRDEELAQAFLAEMERLRNWYELGLARRGRTSFGLAGMTPEELGPFLTGFLNGGGLSKNGRPDREAFHQFHLAVMDLKAYYTEAAMAQPGCGPASDELADWLYGATAAGRLLSTIKSRLEKNENKLMRLLARVLILPGDKQ